MKNIRVCYFGTYRAKYSRNLIMIEGLRRNGVDVIECHYKLWQGIEDRLMAASGRWIHPSFLLRVARAYIYLIFRFFSIRDIDVVILGYPGLPDILVARILTWLRRKPLVWDVFMSVYLIGVERGSDTYGSVTRKLIHKFEHFACSLPDRLIMDTRQYVQWFHDQYGIPHDRFRLVPTGADDRVFQPISVAKTNKDKHYVTYHGTFIPNHGVPNIIEAAKLLEEEIDIQFILIGVGPTYDEAKDLVDVYGLKNVSFLHWLPREELIKILAKSDIVLGAFGSTPQSIMTVQNKIYESLAMAKPTITGDSEAVREAFEHGKQIFLCKREDPLSLANAIKTVISDTKLQQKLSREGYQRFVENYSLDSIGAKFVAHIIEVIESREAIGVRGRSV